MPTTPIPAGSRYVAADLVDQFIADMHPDADADERERIQTTILCAGQHLADCGNPGRWDTLDPATFLPKMPTRDERERLVLCVDLIGLYGWLGAHGLIAPMVGAEILTGLRAAGPDHPTLRELCDKGVVMLAMLDQIPDD